jgi:hypothetical protein
MDNLRQMADNSENGNEVLGELQTYIPINRNLSERLFGQLARLMDKKI